MESKVEKVLEKQKVDKKLAIINSARKLFIQNGFASTSMREIAKDAKVNLAMVNYYFNSKQILFDIIFDEVFENMVNHFDIKLLLGNSTIDNIANFIDSYTEGLIENTEIPGFIFQEVYKNPDLVISRIKRNDHMLKFLQTFLASLNNDIKEGNIRNIENPISFVLNIISMCAFPFIAKPIFEQIVNTDDTEFTKIMRARKKDIIEIFKSYLQITDKN